MSGKKVKGTEIAGLGSYIASIEWVTWCGGKWCISNADLPWSVLLVVPQEKKKSEWVRSRVKNV